MENQPNPNSVTSAESEVTSKEPTMPPWRSIMASHDAFLNDLECLGEMVDLVLPVLNRRDIEREQRIKKLTEEVKIKKDNGVSINIKEVKEFLGHVWKIRQGDRMFRQGIITSIVSKFDEFIIQILNSSYRQNPAWLKNPDKKISYKELLEISSLELLKDEIVAKEIDLLMRDSHYSQLTFLDSKLKLGIEKEFPGWLDFLEITERRNLFVHTGGTVSQQYLENCSKWKIVIDKRIKEGTPLSASDNYIRIAIDCFYELSLRVAQASVRRMFPDKLEDADKDLINKGVQLLSEERWELADRIFSFALSIPEELISKSESKYYFLINRCIARKFAGKDFNDDLHSVDWTPFHPKYHFAVAILEDRFSDAERLMRSEVVKNEVGETNFKDWPLLREFRKTDLFTLAYKDMFGKDYNEQLLFDAAKEIEAQQSEELGDLPSIDA
jgi:hypothetical protein